MHVCVLYDCLFPWTVGGGEKWYRQLAEAHVTAGHRVTYLTLRQWDRAEPPDLPGVRVIAVGPRLALYANGKRRILPPLHYGAGVFLHLLLFGRRYDVVHGASFPFFSLLAAGLVRPLWRYKIAVDWIEVWSKDYWRSYLGRLGSVGWTVQWLCAQIPQTGFSLSELHLDRARGLGVADMTLLQGVIATAQTEAPTPKVGARDVLYAGRMIPEKRVPLLVDALALLMRDDAGLRATLIGTGPDLAEVRRRVAAHDLGDRIDLLGVVDQDTLHAAQKHAAVLVQPSEREGYGLVVVESAARGVPVVVIAGPDNAAAELVEPGRNGFVAVAATPAAVASAIEQALAGGDALRAEVSAWYDRNRHWLSFDHSYRLIDAKLMGGQRADC